VTPQLLARGLGLARIGIGAGIWLAPEAAMGLLGFDSDNPQAMALGRLAGTRDIALGAIALASAGDPVRAPAITRVNAAVDAGDALAFGGAIARREGIDRAAGMGALSALAATALGVWLALKLG